jgi:hypothetical protein
VPQFSQTFGAGAGAAAVLGATGLGFETGLGAGVATGADAAGAISTTGAGAAAVSLAFSSKQPLKVNKLVNANAANAILRVDDFKMIPLDMLMRCGDGLIH